MDRQLHRYITAQIGRQMHSRCVVHANINAHAHKIDRSADVWAVYSNWSSSGWTSQFYAVSSQFTYLWLVPDQVKFVQWKRTAQEDKEEEHCFVWFLLLRVAESLQDSRLPRARPFFLPTSFGIAMVTSSTVSIICFPFWHT